jgi:ornithine carbamoyltransferase
MGDGIRSGPRLLYYVGTVMITNLLSINDLTTQRLAQMLDVGDAYRRGALEGSISLGDGLLKGKSVAMLFEKPSLRTKVSFDVATHELGGHPLFLAQDEVGLDTREPAEDVARVLGRWVSVIVARVNRHSTLERLARSANVPVVNALSDVEHPCQALADLLTIRQRLGQVRGVTVAVVGDANNCALSLALGCAALGAQFRIASPDGFGFSGESVDAINQRYQGSGMAVQTATSPNDAVDGADVIYTDVWASMGQEQEAPARRRAFAGFQVDQKLLSRAASGAILMHPMPAHYGEEVPPGMLDHPQSAAFDQADNRLHVQKAVLRLLVAGE